MGKDERAPLEMFARDNQSVKARRSSASQPEPQGLLKAGLAAGRLAIAG